MIFLMTGAIWVDRVNSFNTGQGINDLNSGTAESLGH